MRGSHGTPPARWFRWPAGIAAAAVLGIAASACSAGGPTAAQVRASARARASAEAKAQRARAAALAAELRITPANGTQDANPAGGITVTSAHGPLTNVTVRTSGSPVHGSLSNGGTVWHSTWALDVSQSYTVTATAREKGHAVRETSTFRTLTPSRTFQAQIYEGSGQTYGVGMPIILYFNQRITDRAAVERALQIRTSKPVTGAWYWDEPCNMAVTCAYFRPRDYWPQNTTVTFTGHLNGVEGAPGVYGDHTLSQTFTIGTSLIVVVSTTSHHMALYRDGRMIDYWPISAGKPGDATPEGTYLTIDKGNPVDMKGPGYNIEVPWSVRFTWSGSYLHDAYWSVGEQGFTNVSHGCVNMPPADAETYYKMEVPGDPVTITGSPRAGTWDNGWTEWFLSWDQYLKGSALHEAVEAGPGGSSFVNPASLPPSTATAPLQTSAPGNSRAS
ncbi:MAG TPA: Ig-like domain-containing protein [Streptosporangiaceae bacterium]|nr:Ig-like domain-containing protein [Streptosporangiaceae bacterium]